MPIEHISDTARWVAIYRAMESERPDALFHDPFARRLGGARGEQIVHEMPRGRASAWAMIVRTALFDEIILRLVRDGADLVLNLAAGLDARPFRLDLPSGLRWVDVDFPDVLAYKRDVLGDAAPRCRYETVPLDLADEVGRRALFGRLGAESRRVLVVSEGLLVYLEPGAVAALARDLHDAAPSVRWWLVDIASPRLLRMMRRMWQRRVQEGGAEFRFAPAEGPDFFRAAGWRAIEFRSTWEESHRLRREMPLAWLWRFIGRLGSEKNREEARRMSGALLLERADEPPPQSAASESVR